MWNICLFHKETVYLQNKRTKVLGDENGEINRKFKENTSVEWEYKIFEKKDTSIRVIFLTKNSHFFTDKQRLH